MLRKEYVDLCVKCSLVENGLFHQKINVPDALKVNYNGIDYYPLGYELTFSDNGQAIHKAILHDLKANSVTHALLDKVNPKIQLQEVTNG